jgi:alanine dehydrogenase
MQQLRVLSMADVRSAVDMPQAIEAMREAFASVSSGDAVVPVRVALDSGHGVHLFMPSLLRRAESAGVKVVSVNPGNARRGLPAVHAVVLLLDPETGRALAVMDGTWLTALRTGAAGGLAADLLARADASIVALFGAGVQARTQLEALRCVRALREVRIVSKTGASAETLAEELGGEPGLRVVRTQDRSAALRGAHVVITATDSATPVFDGGMVEPGTHVTAVGAFTPSMREVDSDLVRRALVVVDQREAALAEAGDLIGALRDGAVSDDFIAAELGEIVAGRHPGRTTDHEITLFKSVGNAAQDVAVAARVLARARERGLGTVVEI